MYCSIYLDTEDRQMQTFGEFRAGAMAEKIPPERRSEDWRVKTFSPSILIKIILSRKKLILKQENQLLKANPAKVVKHNII